MGAGQKIIYGLKEAIAGNIKRVTIEGQTWVRLDKDEKVVIGAAMPHDLFATSVPRWVWLALMIFSATGIAAIWSLLTAFVYMQIK